MERQGIWYEQGDSVYDRMAPADHDRVCWSAAIGSACRIVGGHGEDTARLALAMLADGRAECICRGRAR